MGLGRAGDGALGVFAVRPALLAIAFVLGGCSSISSIVAVGAGAAAGGASVNPAVGYAVAVGVAAGADYGIKWYGRTTQGAEQDAIAAVAAPLDPGQSGTWRIRHTIPIDNEAGELRVVRLIRNPLADCNQVVFSVVAGGGADQTRVWYSADICRQGSAWKWASAEPAVARWGFLQ
jgi:hypothetical protein